MDKPLVMYIDPGIEGAEPDELEPTVSRIWVEWDNDPLVSLTVIV